MLGHCCLRLCIRRAQALESTNWHACVVQGQRCNTWRCLPLGSKTDRWRPLRSRPPMRACQPMRAGSAGARVEALLERLPPGEAAFKEQMRRELSVAQSPSNTLWGDVVNCLESRMSSMIPVRLAAHSLAQCLLSPHEGQAAGNACRNGGKLNPHVFNSGHTTWQGLAGVRCTAVPFKASNAVDAAKNSITSVAGGSGTAAGALLTSRVSSEASSLRSTDSSLCGIMHAQTLNLCTLQ